MLILSVINILAWVGALEQRVAINSLMCLPILVIFLFLCFSISDFGSKAERKNKQITSKDKKIVAVVLSTCVVWAVTLAGMMKFSK